MAAANRVKCPPFIWLTLIATLGLYVPYALAQTAEKINARILPTIWQSSLYILAGDEISIYAGIQNNSGLDFSGSVTFHVDDAEIAKVSFYSSSESLQEIGAKWTATGEGKHVAWAEVAVDLPEGKELLSYESDRSAFEVVEMPEALTFELAKEKVETILSAAADKVDEVAETLALKLESLKKPVPPEGSPVEPTTSANNLLAYAYNSGLDIISFLLRQWKWALAGAAVLTIIFSFV